MEVTVWVRSSTKQPDGPNLDMHPLDPSDSRCSRWHTPDPVDKKVDFLSLEQETFVGLAGSQAWVTAVFLTFKRKAISFGKVFPPKACCGAKFPTFKENPCDSGWGLPQDYLHKRIVFGRVFPPDTSWMAKTLLWKHKCLWCSSPAEGPAAGPKSQLLPIYKCIHQCIHRCCSLGSRCVFVEKLKSKAFLLTSVGILITTSD